MTDPMSADTLIPRRGFDPDDRQMFGGDYLALLQEAQKDLQWLLDRGYAKVGVLDLVSRHYQLTVRQNMALRRCTDPANLNQGRWNKQLDVSTLKGLPIMIDGFNLIILLEVALSKSPVFLGRDGVCRDLAGLRGTYHLIPQTDAAIELILGTLDNYSASAAHFFLDAPVSNSGRLKTRILEHACSYNTPVEVELVRNADAALAGQENIATGDSIVLDRCRSWVNLARDILENQVRDAWVVDLSGHK